MNGEFIIVTDEQAKVLEASGVKVEIVQIVRVANLAAKPAAPEAPQPKPEPRAKLHPIVVRYPNDMLLRWTGLKFTGKPQSAAHVAYLILAEHFSARDAKKVMTRGDINRLLSKELARKGMVFNASTVSYLCEQKYLEPSQQTMPGL